MDTFYWCTPDTCCRRAFGPRPTTLPVCWSTRMADMFVRPAAQLNKRPGVSSMKESESKTDPETLTDGHMLPKWFVSGLDIIKTERLQPNRCWFCTSPPSSAPWHRELASAFFSYCFSSYFQYYKIDMVNNHICSCLLWINQKSWLDRQLTEQEDQVGLSQHKIDKMAFPPHLRPWPSSPQHETWGPHHASLRASVTQQLQGPSHHLSSGWPLSRMRHFVSDGAKLFYLIKGSGSKTMFKHNVIYKNLEAGFYNL